MSRYSRTDLRVLAIASQSTSQQSAAYWHPQQSSCIDCKGSPVDQPLNNAAPDRGLAQLSQQITVTEAAMPITERTSG
jgi:hypothetical protein